MWAHAANVSKIWLKYFYMHFVDVTGSDPNADKGKFDYHLV